MTYAEPLVLPKRTRHRALRWTDGCGGIMLTGSGLQRCRGWWAAAGGRRSSRSRRPRSCAGTVTSSLESGTTPAIARKGADKPSQDPLPHPNGAQV